MRVLVQQNLADMQEMSDTENAAQLSCEGHPQDVFDTSLGYRCPGSGCS